MSVYLKVKGQAKHSLSTICHPMCNFKGQRKHVLVRFNSLTLVSKSNYTGYIIIKAQLMFGDRVDWAEVCMASGAEKKKKQLPSYPSGMYMWFVCMHRHKCWCCVPGKEYNEGMRTAHFSRMTATALIT